MNTNDDTEPTTTNPELAPEPAAQPALTEIHTQPLWQTTVAAMRKEGIKYGQTYTVEFFELRLGAPRDTYGFGTGLAAIRRELEYDGYYLSARGQGGNGYVILDNAKNADVMLGYQATALDCLKRGVILGTNTKLETLTESERRRHEAILARLAQKAALVSRKLLCELLDGQD